MSEGLDVRRAIPVVHGDDPAAARSFYEGLLGMRVSMEQDGMLLFVSRSTPTTQVIVIWPSPTALDPELLEVDISIEVDDADRAFARAEEEGWPIVRGLRDEVWGIRRFFVRDLAGHVVNVAAHLRP
ncbi:VOC family protein [Herbiconiux solani]|uniref:VOC family protein n=1 Tax=Herbiconiux solani TaxID=661329 RepID=UPI0008271A48|nr:VOC family protein [Herbiconiux solani]